MKKFAVEDSVSVFIIFKATKSVKKYSVKTTSRLVMTSSMLEASSKASVNLCRRMRELSFSLAMSIKSLSWFSNS